MAARQLIVLTLPALLLMPSRRALIASMQWRLCCLIRCANGGPDNQSLPDPVLLVDSACKGLFLCHSRLRCSLLQHDDMYVVAACQGSEEQDGSEAERAWRLPGQVQNQDAGAPHVLHTSLSANAKI